LSRKNLDRFGKEQADDGTAKIAKLKPFELMQIE